MMLINGEPGATLPATDRGLHYGDGLFETLAIDGGDPLCLDRHLERLAAGCARLQIPAPDAGILRREAHAVSGPISRGVLKIVITRGCGGRGYAVPPAASPARIVASHPWPDEREGLAGRGIALELCETRLGRNPGLAGLKHLNRLEQVLARTECERRGVDDGLMLDSEGFVISATMSNVFVRFGTRVRTPVLSRCGVQGIVRALVLEALRGMDGIEAVADDIRPAEIGEADECFVTNSVIGIRPVRAFAGHVFAGAQLCRELRDTLVRRGFIVGCNR